MWIGSLVGVILRKVLYVEWPEYNTVLVFFLLGGEDTSMVSQTYDNSANNSAVYDDSVSVTSSNVQMELLTSKKSPSSGNLSGQSESEDTHTSSSVRKEKKHKDKVSSCIFFFSEIYFGCFV